WVHRYRIVSALVMRASSLIRCLVLPAARRNAAAGASTARHLTLLDIAQSGISVGHSLRRCRRAIRRKEEHARAPDAQHFVRVVLGRAAHRADSVARRDEDEVGPLRAHVPRAVAWPQTATHHQADAR